MIRKPPLWARMLWCRQVFRRRGPTSPPPDVLYAQDIAMHAPVTGEPVCAHGVTFDAAAARGLSTEEIRQRWPRLFGACPLGCGFEGIAYASMDHYRYGDW